MGQCQVQCTVPLQMCPPSALVHAYAEQMCAGSVSVCAVPAQMRGGFSFPFHGLVVEFIRFSTTDRPGAMWQKSVIRTRRQCKCGCASLSVRLVRLELRFGFSACDPVADVQFHL
jgi:hypothetical protein